MLGKVSAGYSAVVEYVVAAVIFFIGLVIGFNVKNVEIKVPFRHGDHVIVKSGFFTGQTGCLHTRQVTDNNKVLYTIDWDNEKIAGGTFLESELVLLGSWNSLEKTLRE